jgi:hypothetical protein
MSDMEWSLDKKHWHDVRENEEFGAIGGYVFLRAKGEVKISVNGMLVNEIALHNGKVIHVH